MTASSRSHKKIGIIVGIVCVIALVGMIAWYLIDQHNKEVWTQEHQTYSVEVSFDPFSDDRKASPSVVSVEGCDFEGNEICQQLLVPAHEACQVELMRGEYVVRCLASPISSKGSICDIDQVEKEFEVTEESNLDDEPYKVELPVNIKKIPAEKVSDEAIELIKKAFISAGMDEDACNTYLKYITDAQKEAKDKELAKYVGIYEKEWKVADAEYNPTYSVEIKSIKNGQIDFNMSRTGTNLTWLNQVSDIHASINESGVASFSYDKDDRLGSGKGTLKLKDGYIVLNVVVHTDDESEIPRSFFTDGDLRLDRTKASSLEETNTDNSKSSSSSETNTAKIKNGVYIFLPSSVSEEDYEYKSYGVDSIKITKNALSVIGSAYYKADADADDMTLLKNNSYLFKLNSDTRYGGWEEYGFYEIPFSEFSNAVNSQSFPSLEVWVENGEVTTVCFVS